MKKNLSVQNLIFSVLSVFSCCSVFVLMMFGGVHTVVCVAVMPLVFAATIALLYFAQKNVGLFKNKLIYAACLVFSLLQFFGVSFQSQNDFIYSISSIALLIVCGFGLSIIIFSLLINIYYLLGRNNDSVDAGFSFVKYFGISLAVIFVAWLPALIAYYPSVFAYDSMYQLMQHVTGTYSQSHPMLHTLLVSGLVEFGKTLGSGNIGLCIYSVLQMLTLASAFAYAVAFLRSAGANKIYCYALCGGFALLPFNAVLSVSLTKDVLFTAFAVVYIIKLYQLLTDGDRFFKSKWKIAQFIIFTVLVIMFRNNALYALVLLFGYIIISNKQLRTRFALLAVCALGAYVVLNGSVNAVFHTSGAMKREMFSVPLQQVARVYNYHQSELSDDDKAEFESIIPLSTDDYCGIDKYEPYIADHVKSAVASVPTGDFAKLYIKYLFKYPGDYINAFLQLTSGFWYADDESVAHIYEPQLAELDSPTNGYLMTDFKDMANYADDSTMDKATSYKLHRSSGSSLLYDYYELFSTNNVQYEMPVLKYLFQPAIYCWLVIFAVLFAIKRKQWNMVGVFGFMLLYMATLLLGPCCLIRYAYPMTAAAPVMLGLLMCSKSNNVSESSAATEGDDIG